jgi:hypothetical protein
MSPLIRSVRDLRATVPGVVAFILSIAAGAALVVLVVRGDTKGLGDWGILIGLFLTTINGLLTQANHNGRATDLVPGRVSTTTTVEPDVEPDP